MSLLLRALLVAVGVAAPLVFAVGVSAPLSPSSAALLSSLASFMMVDCLLLGLVVRCHHLRLDLRLAVLVLLPSLSV